MRVKRSANFFIMCLNIIYHAKYHRSGERSKILVKNWVIVLGFIQLKHVSVV